MSPLDQLTLERLNTTLGHSRDLGFLGPGPVGQHLAHSIAFAAAWNRLRTGPPHRLLDLGSGGGLPGLVLAEIWPDSDLFLLESQQRRAEFLRGALSGSRRAGRSTVSEGRAEEIAHGPLRATIDLVTARGFGPPPVVAECAVAFLDHGALLVVSEPPTGGRDRWPEAQLARLGLRQVATFSEPAAVICLERTEAPLSHGVPRRTGMPAKRPLWATEKPQVRRGG